MAAALFNALADPAKARAISAGTNPGERVHPRVVEVMRERGIDISSAKPTKLTSDFGADVLVTMGCGEACPVIIGAEREDWPLDDPKDQTIERTREIRDDIEHRVRALLASRGWT